MFQSSFSHSFPLVMRIITINQVDKCESPIPSSSAAGGGILCADNLLRYQAWHTKRLWTMTWASLLRAPWKGATATRGCIVCWILANPLYRRADIQSHVQGWNYKAIHSPLLWPPYPTIFLILPQDFLHHVCLISLPGLDFIPLLLLANRSPPSF